MPDAVKRFFAPVPESVGQARDFVLSCTLAAWDLEGRADDVRLCVSELATNALAHGTRCGQGFHITIERRGRRHPHRGPRRLSPRRPPGLRRPTNDDVSGRGLHIVDRCSAMTGASRSAGCRARSCGPGSRPPRPSRGHRADRPALHQPPPAPSWARPAGRRWGLDLARSFARPGRLHSAHLLLAHPPGHTAHDTAAAIETRMRQLSAALGSLAPPREVPHSGPRRTPASDRGHRHGAPALRRNPLRYAAAGPTRLDPARSRPRAGRRRGRPGPARREAPTSPALMLTSMSASPPDVSCSEPRPPCLNPQAPVHCPDSRREVTPWSRSNAPG